MCEKLNSLTNVGFVHAGHWSIPGHRIKSDSRPEYALAHHVLSAFAVDERLAYIGKTDITLRDRLQRYRTPPRSSRNGGGTTIKNSRYIRESLLAGGVVGIYVLLDPVGRPHHGRVIQAAAELESSLVAALIPPWNGRPATARSISQELTGVLHAAADRGPSRGLRAMAFRTALNEMLSEASRGKHQHIDIQAGLLHRRTGGYPGPSHAMPSCCSVMRSAMAEEDRVVAEPPKCNGASLTIRYRLPR